MAADPDPPDPLVFGNPPCDRVVELEVQLLPSDAPPTRDEIDAALAEIEAMLREHPGSYGTCIWDAISRLCHDPRTSGHVLDWLRPLAQSLPKSQRIGLVIGTLAILPEPPTSWPVLRRLWFDFWFTSGARWCVFEAYSLYPSLMKKHLRRFQRIARSERRPLPRLREHEYPRWLETLKPVE